jgi:hypothetical protein
VNNEKAAEGEIVFGMISDKVSKTEE